MGLKAKLGLDVFKHDKEPHIKIKPGMEKDARLKKAVLVCPAGLYSENAAGEVELTIDGCLECVLQDRCGLKFWSGTIPTADAAFNSGLDKGARHQTF
jgi:ferredoxin like protein